MKSTRAGNVHVIHIFKKTHENNKRVKNALGMLYVQLPYHNAKIKCTPIAW